MEHKDERLNELMKLAKRDLPFDDFEDRVMANIEKIAEERETLYNYKRYSLLFFILGTLFGLALNYLLAESIEFLQVSEGFRRMLELGTQLVYVLLIVLFSDRLLRLLKSAKKANYTGR
ncbi:hypothetical protein PQ465_06740 [Sphingobacterium oryzagri]|uniref:Holin-X, holin superfamily III n=1 Tax=Sphingobacterium oryzagri TaxID=3025669 RepID=A0ABY7WKG2_9SPHI|nr:hypothetical protein [Sphingobacterium sp. KACC 22765]WDF70069.1 hypothetical protein PQ465_06740 [Sphingobacterium sp. KACC 22765]